MEKLIPLRKTFSICKHKFSSYSLDQYDFESNIDFKNHPAIYIFSHRTKRNLLETPYKFKFVHYLLYGGKTENARTRFNDHHKLSELKGRANTISICYCKENQLINIENELLKKYNFKYNTMNNIADGPHSIIEEDL